MRMGGINLRLRLSMGAATLAAFAIIAAFLAAYGVRQALWLSNEAAVAQRRIDAYGALSARITEVILTPAAQRSGVIDAVLSGFAGLDLMVIADVAAAQGDAARNRAAQSLSLARMRDAFLRLTQDLNALAAVQGAPDAALNSFAQVFSPLMRDQLEADRLRRDAALSALETLQRQMVTVALSVALAATVVLMLLYFLLIRPLLARLSSATLAIGLTTADARPTKLALGPRDELALLFARLNQMTARLDRRRANIAADRAQLETMVAERTAALEAANAKLARTDEDRRRFFADVSHELRTPLTVILAEAELGAAACPAELEATFTTIRSRAARLNRRIEDLLRIARSETGQLELDPRPTDIGTVLDTAAEDLRPLLTKARFKVERHRLGAAPAQADPDWLRQIAGGIIGNAVKYAGPEATLQLTSGTEAGRSFFEISDNGPGFSAKDTSLPASGRTAAPTRFANGSATVAGSFGIGLALARWVTEAQGGTLSLASPVAEGRGFSVRIALPQHIPFEHRVDGQGVPA